MDRKKLSKPIGKICKEARQRFGVSVSDMAKLLKVSKNAVYRFERGHYDTASFLLFYIYYFFMDLNHAKVVELLLEVENDK